MFAERPRSTFTPTRQKRTFGTRFPPSAGKSKSLAVILTVFLSLFVSSGAPAQTATPRASSAHAVPGVQELALALGDQHVLSTEGVRSYSEGVKGIVDVRLTADASEFIVVAERAGSTTLLLLMKDGSERHYRIEVRDPARRASESTPDSVAVRENIRLDFYFVELRRSYAHQIGVGYPSSVAPTFSAAYDVASTNLDSATAVITEQALPRLDMAQVSGFAKILRKAAVITANGEKASFAGGGEVNVPVQSALSSGVQKIPYGSLVEVAPRYDATTGRVELHLHADISELDTDRGTGIPGRTTASLDTIVNLELGQSLILGGLSAKSSRSTKGGLPGLSQIPVLGLLFGSHGKTEDETENIVVIVPSVVDAVSQQARRRIEQALQQYREYDGAALESALVPSPQSRRTGGAK